MHSNSPVRLDHGVPDLWQYDLTIGTNKVIMPFMDVWPNDIDVKESLLDEGFDALENCHQGDRLSENRIERTFQVLHIAHGKVNFRPTASLNLIGSFGDSSSLWIGSRWSQMRSSSLVNAARSEGCNWQSPIDTRMRRSSESSLIFSERLVGSVINDLSSVAEQSASEPALGSMRAALCSDRTSEEEIGA